MKPLILNSSKDKDLGTASATAREVSTDQRTRWLKTAKNWKKTIINRMSRFDITSGANNMERRKCKKHHQTHFRVWPWEQGNRSEHKLKAGTSNGKTQEDSKRETDQLAHNSGSCVPCMEPLEHKSDQRFPHEPVEIEKHERHHEVPFKHAERSRHAIQLQHMKHRRLRQYKEYCLDPKDEPQGRSPDREGASSRRQQSKEEKPGKNPSRCTPPQGIQHDVLKSENPSRSPKRTPSFDQGAIESGAGETNRARDLRRNKPEQPGL